MLTIQHDLAHADIAALQQLAFKRAEAANRCNPKLKAIAVVITLAVAASIGREMRRCPTRFLSARNYWLAGGRE